MKYIIAGDGSMPIKEIPDVVAELADPEEAVYICGPKTRYRVGETLLGTGAFGNFVVAVPNEDMAADLTPSLQDADDIVLWELGELLEAAPDVELLALIPAEDEPVDEFLEDLVARACAAGIRCRAMNEQMYDIELGDEEADEPEEQAAAEPEPEEPAAEPEPAEVTIPTATEMESMPRADLKTLAKSVGATPSDWRSKSAIIDAILQAAGDAKGEDPYENGGADEVDLDAVEAEVKSLGEDAVATVRVEGIEVPIPSDTSLTEAPTVASVLSELLAGIVLAINEARAKLEDLD